MKLADIVVTVAAGELLVAAAIGLGLALQWWLS